MARKPGRMKRQGDRVFNRTDNELVDQEVDMLLTTSIDWEDLRPEVGDDETYDRLIAEVKAATAQNENIAQLKNRLEALGERGVKLIKKVVALVP